MTDKLLWHVKLTSIQPRIRLLRSFSERSHAYLGYCLRIDGAIKGESRAFSVGIGRVAQAKHEFQVGDEITGESLPVPDDRLEPVEFYKVSKLKPITRGAAVQTASPPWHGPPLTLEVYRERGHRRLAEQACSNNQRAFGMDMGASKSRMARTANARRLAGGPRGLPARTTSDKILSSMREESLAWNDMSAS